MENEKHIEAQANLRVVKHNIKRLNDLLNRVITDEKESTKMLEAPYLPLAEFLATLSSDLLEMTKDLHKIAAGFNKALF